MHQLTHYVHAYTKLKYGSWGWGGMAGDIADLNYNKPPKLNASKFKAFLHLLASVSQESRCGGVEDLWQRLPSAQLWDCSHTGLCQRGQLMWVPAYSPRSQQASGHHCLTSLSLSHPSLLAIVPQSKDSARAGEETRKPSKKNRT